MSENAPLLANARTMSAGYSDSEDRLWLRFGANDGAVQMWMTRRLLALVFNQLWAFMQDSCPPMPGTPTDSTGTDAARALALRAEREVALEARPPLNDSQARQAQPVAMSHKPVQGGVLSRIVVERTGQKVKLVFNASAGQVVMSCGRPEVHRMMNMLAKRAESCGWRLQTLWLGD